MKDYLKILIYCSVYIYKTTKKDRQLSVKYSSTSLQQNSIQNKEEIRKKQTNPVIGLNILSLHYYFNSKE